jgi:hypothetical protein
LSEQDLRAAFLQKSSLASRAAFLSSRFDPHAVAGISSNASFTGAAAAADGNASVTSSLSGGSQMFAVSSAAEKYLTRCAFKLNGLQQYHLGDIYEQGDVYISNGTGKLFLALSIDAVMSEVLQQHMHMGDVDSVVTGDSGSIGSHSYRSLMNGNGKGNEIAGNNGSTEIVSEIPSVSNSIEGKEN